jgi:hypothetical protein
MAHQVIKEKTQGIMIVEPYYAIESKFSTPNGQRFMKKHLQATRRRIRRIITFSYLIFP